MSHWARIPGAYANTRVTRRNPASGNAERQLCRTLTGLGSGPSAGACLHGGAADLLLVERDAHTCPRR